MIQFNADRVSLRGPKQDGTWTVSFDVGEYERDKLKALLDIGPETALAVSVEVKGA